MPRAPTPAAPSPPLTVRQAAELLAVSVTTIYAACHSGELRHFKFGKASIRIYQADLEAYRDAHVVGPPLPDAVTRSNRPRDDDFLGVPESLKRHMSPGWRKKLIPSASN